MTTEEKLNTILKAVCEEYNLTKKDILERTRKRVIVEKRQILFYLCEKYTTATYYLIGEVFVELDQKRYDHATVLHSKRTITNLITSDEKIRDQVFSIENELEEVIESGLIQKKSKSFIKLRQRVIRALKTSKDESILINELTMLL